MESATATEFHAALDRPWWRLRFPAALEANFQHVMLRGRAARVAVCTALSGATFYPITWDDAQRMPDIADVQIGVKQLLALLLIGLMGSLALHLRGRLRLSAAQIEWGVAVSLLTTATYSLISSHYAADIVTVTNTGAIFLIFAYSALLVRQQFRFALGTALFTFFGYLAVVEPHNATEAVVVAGNIRLFGTAMLFTLVANYVMELQERRTFLLRRLDVERRRVLHASAQELRLLAERDALTGLANRRYLDNEFALAWQEARAAGSAIGLVLLDVDHFKRYNDRYGHPAGDECLKQVAQALRLQAERHTGIAARMGGEEFALLLPGRTPDQAAQAAADLCAAVRALALPHTDSPTAGHLTVSAGVAMVSPATCGDPGRLMRVADRALYEAKHGGRDRFVCAADPAARPALLTQVRAAAFGPSVPASASGFESPGSDILSVDQPAANEEPVAEVRPTADWVVIEWLGQVLSNGLGWLRFPADLEAAYHQSRERTRPGWLLALGLGGMVYLLSYVWFCKPMFPDIAETFYPRLLALNAVLVLPILGVIWLPMRWWMREALFALAAGLMGVGVTLLVSASQAATVHSYSLSLFLIPMFCAVVAGQPFRFSLVPSVLICVTASCALYPPAGEQRLIWFQCTVIQWNALLFSLIAGYRLEFSQRRNFVLFRLEAAQRRALTESNQHLQRLATIDPLTGLPNRRQFEADQQQAWTDCAARGRPLGLLIIDIDHFKPYNDGYGHPAGDDCLRRVGRALNEWVAGMAVAASDAGGPAAASASLGPRVCRLGGEEFGVLLPGDDLSRARVAADRLGGRLGSLGIAHHFSPVADHLTVSIGVASVLPSASGDMRALLKRADAALYRAKSRGRDRVAA